MGNEQSNTRTKDEKTFRIEQKDNYSGSDFFRCHLDDYVSYSNGERKHIDFKNQNLQQTGEFLMDIFGMPAGVNTPYLS